jgi:CheY-like chemotaxis protein
MADEILKGKKILIVEDDLSSRLLLNAGDGKEALDAAVADPDIEIILMDIQLPVMDGYVAAKKIKEIRSNIKIIAQTAYGLSGDTENLIASGFDDYIIKPIYSGQLIEKLSSYFK